MLTWLIAKDGDQLPYEQRRISGRRVSPLREARDQLTNGRRFSPRPFPFSSEREWGQIIFTRARAVNQLIYNQGWVAQSMVSFSLRGSRPTHSSKPFV